MLKPGLVGLGCLLVLGCGGEAPPAKAPAPAPSVAVTAAPPTERAPSAEVSKYWTFNAPQPIAAYANLASLLRTELMRSLVPELLQLLQEQMNDAERACVRVAVEHAQELLVAGDSEQGLFVLTLGPDGVKAARSACVGSLLPTARATVTGSDEAYQIGERGVAAFTPAAVLLGSPALVEAALAPGAKPSPVPASLTLRGDEHLAADVATGGVHVTGRISASAERFGLDAQVEMPSEALAENVEKQVVGRRAQVAAMLEQQENGAMLRQLVDALRIERRGKTFDVGFETRGTPEKQARDLGVLSALAAHGFRRYTQQAKAAEARFTLAEIAKAYSRAFAEGSKSKGPKKLTSLPAVPASVPRATAYQSTVDDWKAWTPIAFSLAQPQRYQYDVVAAKDGKSAEVRAKGDLDGDGVTSLYVLKIKLDSKTGVIQAESLDETEPLE